MKSIITLTAIILLLILNPKSTAADDDQCTVCNIDVVNLGAKPDGKTDSSKAFQAAWTAACKSKRPSTICVPEGKYLVKSPLTFDGKKCKNNGGIRFVLWGTVVGPTDYTVLGNGGYWLSFHDVDGVTITGSDGGGFDGQGDGLWDCKTSGGSDCPDGATTLRFTGSTNIVINGITSLNSQLYHIVIDGCNNVQVEGVTVSASGTSPNTDGIHVQKSTDVAISNSKISTGDDCISIGAGTNNLWIENVACGPGHGISIGSLGKEKDELGVQNVTVSMATFTGTENGVRIKTWGRPTNGYVKNVLFQHLTMVNAQNPIVIDQHYCPGQENCPGKESGIRISDITYQNIQGSSATEIAVKFDCSSKHPCTNIQLDDVTRLTIIMKKPSHLVIMLLDQLPVRLNLEVASSSSYLHDK